MDDITLLEEEKSLCKRMHEEFDLNFIEWRFPIDQILLNIRWIEFFHDVKIPIVWKHIDELILYRNDKKSYIDNIWMPIDRQLLQKANLTD